MAPGYKRALLLLIDLLLLGACWILAYNLRWAESGIPRSDSLLGDDYLLQMQLLLFPAVATFIGLLFVLKFYQGIWRYSGITELRTLGITGAIWFVGWLGFSLFLDSQATFLDLPQRLTRDGGTQVLRIPIGVLASFVMMGTLAIGFVRLLPRLLTESATRSDAAEAPKTLIVGAGDLADGVVRNILRSGASDFHLVCAVTQQAARVGMRLHGIPVVGTLDKIPDVIRENRIQQVLIALDNQTPAELRRVVLHCEKQEVSFRIVPSLRDLGSGRVEVSTTRAIEVEDLLGREPVELHIPEERNYLKGTTVLITGAGGSIGSELSRQCAAAGARRLVLVGKGENSIFEIEGILRRDFPEVEVIALIADVREPERMDVIFRDYRPDTVFHAAAHKHVPLMESAPDEAIKNNILGTASVAIMADRHGVQRFVLISSDKAVRPSSVMGATKRAAELVVFALAAKSKCCFQAVRFGNVLGSRGSVIPTFRRQIAAGGPVTITHPDVTRYFMTIPEAVSLVLQAGSRHQNGALYLLDMGEPVRIADLAKNMISLSGLRPEIDIPIKYIGLRPGEKLREELLTESEGAEKTELNKIFTTRPGNLIPYSQLRVELEKCRELAEEGNIAAIRQWLRAIVPDYHPPQDGLPTDAEVAAAIRHHAAQVEVAAHPADALGLVDEALELPETNSATPSAPVEEHPEPVSIPAVITQVSEPSTVRTVERQQDFFDDPLPEPEIPVGSQPEVVVEPEPAVDSLPTFDQKPRAEEVAAFDEETAVISEASVPNVEPAAEPIEAPAMEPPDEAPEVVDPPISEKEAERIPEPLADAPLPAPGVEAAPVESAEAELAPFETPFFDPEASPDAAAESEPTALEPAISAELSQDSSIYPQAPVPQDLNLELEPVLSQAEGAPDNSLIEPTEKPVAPVESIVPDSIIPHSAPQSAPTLLAPPVPAPEPEALMVEGSGDFFENAAPHQPAEDAPEIDEPQSELNQQFATSPQEVWEDMARTPIVIALRVTKGTDSQTLNQLVQVLDAGLGPDDALVCIGEQAALAALPASVAKVTREGKAEGAAFAEAVALAPKAGILLTTSTEVIFEQDALDVIAEALTGPGAVAYSDYREDRDGTASDVKLHDHEGCPHERFEFGPVIAYRLADIAKVGGIRGDLNYAWEYDLHLKLMELAEFAHITQITYTRFVPVVVDDKGKKVFSPGMGPLGGFSYVFYPEDVEKEVTSVWEEALKRRGAWIDHPAVPVNHEGRDYPLMASIVIPILNRVKYIANAIEKVQKGTFQDFEMVIVDNGSTDGTIEAVQKIAAADSRIRLLHGKGGSIASALNEGIKAARGKYICQLDSDDEYAPDCLEQMIGHLESHPNCGLAISYYRLMDENGVIIEDVAPITHSGYSRNQILRRDGGGAVRIFPKAVLEEFGYYDEVHYGNFGEDYDMVLKTGEKYDVDRVHKVLYHYRRHADNTDVTRDPAMKYKNKNRARQEALRRRKEINKRLGKA